MTTLRHRSIPAKFAGLDLSRRMFVGKAHPSEPNHFAKGLRDGGVHVLKPLESEGRWGTSPPIENGARSSTTSGAAFRSTPR
ncbi:unnamed protein product [Prunus armeniaca]